MPPSTLTGLMPLPAYFAAAAWLARFLSRGEERDRILGVRALWLGGLLQGGSLLAQGAMVSDGGWRVWPDGLAAVSLLLALSFLAPRLQRAGAVGAFVAPLAAAFSLVAFLARALRLWSHEASSALLVVHVGLNLLGIVAFALAAAAATAYVIQERNLRAKRLGGPFSRLPPLDVLDTIGLRFTVAGFPLLTLGIATGTVFAFEDPSAGTGFSPMYLLALAAWALFAAVLLLRVLVGWRGRRAAMGTILGFLCTVLVLVGYAVRDWLQGGGA